jgi:hypothetical protein
MQFDLLMFMGKEREHFMAKMGNTVVVLKNL